MNLVRFAWRNVFRNKRRTLITAGIFCVGTVSMLMAAGFIFSTFFGLRELTISSEIGHLQVGVRNVFDRTEEKVMQYGLSAEQLHRINDVTSAMPDVRFTMARISFEGLISNGERTIAIVGSGVDTAKEAKLSSLFVPIVKGAGFPEQQSESATQIMLASELAANLNAKPGDSLTVLSSTVDGALNALDLTVVGIYSTGVPEQDRRSVLIPLRTAQDLLRTSKVSRVVIVLSNTEQTEIVAEQLKAKLGEFDVRTWSDLAFFYHRVVRLYSNVFAVMGTILLAVILLSATNSMIMNVMERVREIGTFRALGISRRQVIISFVNEGAQIGLLGGVAGIVLGVLLASTINFLQIPMPPPPGRNISYPLIIMIRGDFTLLVLVTVVLLGAMSAWLPSYRAARGRVVEALSHV